jgi:hypothetical protein
MRQMKEAPKEQLEPVHGFQSDYGFRGLSVPSMSSAPCGFRWLADDGETLRG